MKIVIVENRSGNNHIFGSHVYKKLLFTLRRCYSISDIQLFLRSRIVLKKVLPL